jgi:NAD(P)-dependent dehydrogenase (short-subunit alcohol dehydrogenase family)
MSCCSRAGTRSSTGRSGARWPGPSPARGRGCSWPAAPGQPEAVAADIRHAGGTADTAEVDALDERAVDAHADAVASQAGSIDICMNVISHGDVQGTPFVEMALETTSGRSTRPCGRRS